MKLKIILAIIHICIVTNVFSQDITWGRQNLVSINLHEDLGENKTYVINIFDESRLPKTKYITNEISVEIDCPTTRIVNLNRGYGLDYPFVISSGDVVDIYVKGDEIEFKCNNTFCNDATYIHKTFNNCLISYGFSTTSDAEVLINNYEEIVNYITGINLEKSVSLCLLQEVLYKLIYDLALCDQNKKFAKEFVKTNKQMILNYNVNSKYSKSYISGLYGYCSIVSGISLSNFSSESAVRLYKFADISLPQSVKYDMLYYLILEQLSSSGKFLLKNESLHFLERSNNPLQRKIISSKLKLRGL